MTQPKTDLAYLRNKKDKAEQKLRSCQHREKILERRMSELNRRERVHRLCTRAGMLESFLGRKSRRRRYSATSSALVMLFTAPLNFVRESLAQTVLSVKDAGLCFPILEWITKLSLLIN